MDSDKTNREYRNADIERWRTQDFTLGYEIKRSRNAVCDCEICRMGEGSYPLSFEWNGWHDGCICYLSPILVSPDEMAKVTQMFLQGKKYDPKGNQVTDIPQSLKDYVKSHPECKESDWYRNNIKFFEL